MNRVHTAQTRRNRLWQCLESIGPVDAADIPDRLLLPPSDPSRLRCAMVQFITTSPFGFIVKSRGTGGAYRCLRLGCGARYNVFLGVQEM